MKKSLLSILLLFCALTTFAQTINVSGVIRDSIGETVIGAAVMLEGNPSVGVITDIDGRYSISVDAKAKLIVSCISFKNATVAVDGRRTIDIVLENENVELEEVVVVGYGSMRKSDLTGAITSVKINEEDAARSETVDQILQGKASGVNIVNNSFAPDAGVDIRIRGTNSFNSDNQPLYVIDGVIISGASEKTSMLSRGSDSNDADQETNGLMGINPQDIASIEILKDASATAIFGSEGANGVVMITTKSASKDNLSINASAGINLGFRTKRIDVLEFNEYVDYYHARGWDPSRTKFYDESGNLKVTPVDWQEYSTQTAVTQRYFLSVSGKPNKLSYYFSAGLNKNQGLLKTTGYDSFTARFNVDANLSKKVKIGLKSNFSYTHTNMTQAKSGQQSSSGSFTRAIISYYPYKNLSDKDEELLEFDDTQTTGPDKWLTDFVNTKDRFRVIPSIYLDWQISKIFGLKANLGGEYNMVSSDRWKSQRLSTQTGSTAARSRVLSGRYNGDVTLRFNKKFKYGHRLYGTAGVSFSKRFSESESLLGWDILQYKEKMSSINTSPSTEVKYSEGQSSILSGYLRAVYNYKDRYVLTSTYRLDGSSKFEGKNKWGHFPSFAFAWRMSEEPWFGNNVISMTKLRAGWGLVGNQTIGSFKTSQNYSSSTVSTHGNDPIYSQIALYRSNVPNQDLKWETTQQTNIGLDMSILKGRISFTAEAYYKVTYDLLKNMTIASSNGFSSIAMNSGSVQNAGFEFTLDAVPVKKTKNWEWTLGGNISLNRNKILSIGTGKSESNIRVSEDEVIRTCYYSGSQLTTSSQSINIFAEGLPMGVFYGYVFDGIVQDGEEGLGFSKTSKRGPGYIKYKDLNNDGYISASDKMVIGDPNPDFTYGFSTALTWKTLTLSAAFTGSYGNEIYNLNSYYDYNVGGGANNVMADAYRKAWTPENKSNEYPAIGCMTSTDYQDMHCTRYVEDGSYLRLANVSLSYRIPLKKRKDAILKGITVSGSVKNAVVWTKYSGWDPEVNSFGSDLNKMGVDSNSYPQMRSFVFDLIFRF